MLINCTCKSDYQDERYGPGKRVANPKGPAKQPGIKGYTCTVCGRLDDSKKAAENSKKK